MSDQYVPSTYISIVIFEAMYYYIIYIHTYVGTVHAYVRICIHMYIM